MFADYLLLMFTTTPRRSKALFNLLRGRRTVSTLFAGLVYQRLDQLDSWHGVPLAKFEAATGELIAAGWLSSPAAGQLQLTTAGQAQQAKLQQTLYLPQAWDQFQQVDVRRFEALSQLALQVVSEAVHHQRQYYPISTDPGLQATVKQWLRQWYRPELGATIYQELRQFLQTVSPDLATIFAASLTGHAFPGQTDQQLAERFECSAIEILVIRKDLTCLWIKWLRQTNQGPLAALLRPLVKSTPVSNSAWQTYQALKVTPDLMQIARQRHLKLSTVREHLLEVAILMPEFPYQQLLTTARVQRLTAIFATNPAVETWQFATVSAVEPQLDFFWFRLFQIMRCHNATH
ncbi:hypothetical protein C5Z25_00990 [Lactobacillus sp. CBA3605]|uniref:helix-turn-helix domain-containing protein n=1 Tax=Lactobacillus sp. CBA3605 TaxID=2099788 RepID=UPI000CFDE333|nr:helix-turn-helix domain-containing protein [Lactobacillus sp. CBA3605]AVK60438.1 hypothetical protein C5Z25_00990 [Lactobacillus sp. CBA3605]